MAVTTLCCTVEGLSIHIGDLRRLVTWAGEQGIGDHETVDVHVGPTYDNPTDPGGEIRLEVTATVEVDGSASSSLVEIPKGNAGYEDNGVLDFGRERVIRDIATDTTFTIPKRLVDFIKGLT